jgi:hypothetical protein
MPNSVFRYIINMLRNLTFNVHGSVHRNNILLYKSQQDAQSYRFYLTTALRVSGVTITHLQEHKTTVTTASGNCYTVIDRVKKMYCNDSEEA